MTRPTKAYVDAALAEARCDPDADHVMPRDEALDTLAAEVLALRAELDAAGEQDITINQLQHELECVRKVCNDARASCYPHGRAAVPAWVLEIERALGDEVPT